MIGLEAEIGYAFIFLIYNVMPPAFHAGSLRFAPAEACFAVKVSR
jgi:hypothetical protein